ncbi:MAG: histidine phosphatase family protein [bacterium]|jgi:broad specificity phosphatase PhoE|nr:histidine phosphatase family protein [Gammaproteobacteria bacterium]HIL85225.1 histidine phosphatase family protein [Pseudomonadales bacterium]
MTPGETTVGLVEQLTNEGVDHIVLLMRHSAREYAPGKHDLLNPLTDEGRDLARDMGKRLPKGLVVRGYTSPAERCIETAGLIMSGHEAAGGQILRNRVVEALGVFYALDQMKMFKSMRDAGGIVSFLQRWFDGGIARDILMPADLAARLVGGVAKEKLSQTGDDPQLDLLVSHDFTLYTIKDQLLKQGTHRYPDVHCLDGVAFFNRDGKTFIQSHHEPAIELDVSLPV